LRRRRADSNVCAGCCSVHAVNASQHQGVALTDRSIRADRGGVTKAIGRYITLVTDAREEFPVEVGVERSGSAGGVAETCPWRINIVCKF
jgi:hypothetical protein